MQTHFCIMEKVTLAWKLHRLVTFLYRSNRHLQSDARLVSGTKPSLLHIKPSRPTCFGKITWELQELLSTTPTQQQVQHLWHWPNSNSRLVSRVKDEPTVQMELCDCLCLACEYILFLPYHRARLLNWFFPTLYWDLIWFANLFNFSEVPPRLFQMTAWKKIILRQSSILPHKNNPKTNADLHFPGEHLWPYMHCTRAFNGSFYG